MELTIMPKFISTKEATARSKYQDSSTIRRAILNGWLKATKLGHDWLIEEKDFKKWQDADYPVYPKKN